MVGRTGSDLRRLPLPVFGLEPPYTRFEPLADLASLDPAWLPRGTILALGIGQLEPEAAANSKQDLEGAAASGPDGNEVGREAAALVESIPVLRSRYLAQPLVLRVGGLTDRAALEIARLAAELHIRGVLLDGDDPGATLRHQLTDPEHLGPDLLVWLAYGGDNVSGFSRFAIEEIFRGARRHEHLYDILPPLGIGSISDVRKHFRDEGLPEPRKWRRLAQALYAVLHLQRHRGSLFDHAIDLGYSEGPSLSHQVAGVFGVPPGTIKQTIGWQWCAYSWLRRRQARGDFAGWR